MAAKNGQEQNGKEHLRGESNPKGTSRPGDGNLSDVGAWVFFLGCPCGVD